MKRDSANSKRTRAQSRWLGVFVAVWLNLAVQPCAMALGLDRDCPHCPPVQHEDMAHHGHHAEEVDAGCDSLLSDCGEPDEYSVDGRHSVGKVKDKVDDVQMVLAPVTASLLSPVAYATTAADPPRPPAPSAPLYLLNCVFLD